MVFFPLSSILQGFDAPLKSWGADSVSLANCPSTQARTSACRSPARLHEVTVNAKPSWSSPGTASRVAGSPGSPPLRPARPFQDLRFRCR